MIDDCYQLRKRMIVAMQSSLKRIRQLLGIGVQEFGDFVGLTRQTINNLENQKTEMSPIHYIAVCAIIDRYMKDKPELLPVISSILKANDNVEFGSVFEDIGEDSLLDKWFLCFPSMTEKLEFTSNIEENELGRIASNYRVFLDDSVLLEDGFLEGIKPFICSMKEKEKKFIVPVKVIESIQQLVNSENHEEITIAQNAMVFLMWMQKEGVVDYRGEKSDINLTSTLVSVFAKFKCVNRLALITCNQELAELILSLNNGTLGGFRILVLKYSKEKGFENWEKDDGFKGIIQNQGFENGNSINNTPDVFNNAISCAEL